MIVNIQQRLNFKQYIIHDKFYKNNIDDKFYKNNIDDKFYKINNKFYKINNKFYKILLMIKFIKIPTTNF